MEEAESVETTQPGPQDQQVPDSSNEAMVADSTEPGGSGEGEAGESMVDSTIPDPLTTASLALERETMALPHSLQDPTVSTQPSLTQESEVPQSNGETSHAAEEPNLQPNQPLESGAGPEAEGESEGPEPIPDPPQVVPTESETGSSEAVDPPEISSTENPDLTDQDTGTGEALPSEMGEESSLNQQNAENDFAGQSSGIGPPELERHESSRVGEETEDTEPDEGSPSLEIQVNETESEEKTIPDEERVEEEESEHFEVKEKNEPTVSKVSEEPEEESKSVIADEPMDQSSDFQAENAVPSAAESKEMIEAEAVMEEPVPELEEPTISAEKSISPTQANETVEANQNAQETGVESDETEGKDTGPLNPGEEEREVEKQGGLTDDEIEFVASVPAQPEPITETRTVVESPKPPQVPPIRLKLSNVADGLNRFSTVPTLPPRPPKESFTPRPPPPPPNPSVAAINLSRKDKRGLVTERREVVGGWEGGQGPDPLLALLTTRPNSPPPFHFAPPPSDLNIPIPVGGYPCNDCGSVYAMKSLREFHLERRVMRIQAFCVVCCTNHVFFNRCRYLEHIRLHSKERSLLPGGVLKDVKIRTFTTEELDKAFEDWWSCPALDRISDLCALYEYEFGTKVSIRPDETYEGPTVEEPGPKKVPEPPKPEKIVEKLPPPKPYTNCHCSECGQEFGSPEDLKKHFVYNLPPHQKQYICQTCSAVYFSPCGSSAHKRVHRAKEEQRNPFTCAECGALQKSSRELAAHLAGHRTAPTILNAWRCPKCFTFYSNWTTLVVHTASAHSFQLYKCNRCSSPALGLEALDKHLRSCHNTTASAEGTQPFFKCFQCDTMRKSKDELVEHLKSHYGGLAPFKVFRCPICGRLLENKQGLVSHLGRSHGTVMKQSEILEFPFKIPDAAPTSSSPAPPKRPPTEDLPASPPKKKSGGIEPQKEYASVPAPPTRGPSAGNSRGGNMARLPGTGPGTLLPSLPPGLNVDGSIKCPYCPPDKEPLPNEFMMRLHLKVKHPDKAAQLSSDPNKKKARPSTDSSQAKTTPESKTLGKAGNSPGTFICPKCSTLFYSENSIKRHFLAVHRQPSTEGMVKCTVCKEGFPTQPQLDAHSKQHGLHFLQKSLHTNP